MTNDKWYSIYPPGHALMLAPWAAAGIPWVLNPLLGALSATLMYFYGKSYYGKNIGILSMILAAFSPLIIFMSSEYMSHATCMFYVLIFAILFKKALSSGNTLMYAMSGFALGFVILTRPYTGFALSIPFVARLFFVTARRELPQTAPPRSPLSGAAAFLAALTAAGLILMAYNTATNGNPLKLGYTTAEWATVSKLGFGERITGVSYGNKFEFTPRDGLNHVLQFVGSFNRQLFGWPIPDLAFAALLFLLMFRRTAKEDFFQLGVFLSVLGAHVFYWYIDDVFGPRLVYETTPMLIVLTVRGLMETYAILNGKWLLRFKKATETVPQLERARAQHDAPPQENNSFMENQGRGTASIAPFAMLAVLVLCFAVFSLTKTFPALYDKYSHNYIGAKCGVCRVIRGKDIHNAVILIRSNHVRFASNMILFHDSPLLDNDVVFARDQGDQNPLIMRQFRGRIFYLYEAYFTGSWERSQMVFEKFTRLSS
ncbi:glycosyltransferase family 39 protein [Candidatus Poribacteria bacterium]|nr:glycosyltransferase family 39 protein [Candidatus Poribacteria bacterium]